MDSSMSLLCIFNLTLIGFKGSAMIFKVFLLICSSSCYAQIQTGLLSGRVDAVVIKT